VACDRGDNLEAGDLIVFVEAGAPNAPPLTSIDADPLATIDAAAAGGNGAADGQQQAAAAV
ncbi:hypothetical protein MNEG_16255, partial [Monoraphidium neglectum]